MMHSISAIKRTSQPLVVHAWWKTVMMNRTLDARNKVTKSAEPTIVFQLRRYGIISRSHPQLTTPPPTCFQCPCSARHTTGLFERHSAYPSCSRPQPPAMLHVVQIPQRTGTLLAPAIPLSPESHVESMSPAHHWLNVFLLQHLCLETTDTPKMSYPSNEKSLRLSSP